MHHMVTINKQHPGGKEGLWCAGAIAHIGICVDDPPLRHTGGSWGWAGAGGGRSRAFLLVPQPHHPARETPTCRRDGTHQRGCVCCAYVVVNGDDCIKERLGHLPCDEFLDLGQPHFHIISEHLLAMDMTWWRWGGLAQCLRSRRRQRLAGSRREGGSELVGFPNPCTHSQEVGREPRSGLVPAQATPIGSP